MIIYLAAAIIPTIVIMSYIMAFDKYKKEPTKLCFKLFFYGCLTVIPAVILENRFSENGIYTYQDLFNYVFVGVALIEEGVKFIATYYIAYHDNAFDEYYDGIIYCVLVSLGFATIENIMYVFTYGLQTALVRAVTAVPAHTIFACSMGYFLAMSKAKPKYKIIFMILSLLVPILLHTNYDFIVMANFHYGWLIFAAYIYFLYKNTIKLIHKTSNRAPFK